MLQVDIIERCKQNDRRSQMALYKQYCDAMFCVANRFLKNTHDAEDVMQESFVKAFQKLHQFTGEVSFGAWLKRIVVNKSIDKLRAEQERWVQIDDMPLSIADDNDWMVEESLTIDEVKSAIEKLPEKYKYVVMLYLMEGYDHSEISEILQISETASRTQLMRGKLKLRELLKHKRNGTGS